MEDIIVNIPTGTRENYNKPGIYATNIIMQELSNIYKLKQIYTFNTMDSYENKFKYLKYYLENIDKIRLLPDDILVDSNFNYTNYLDF